MWAVYNSYEGQVEVFDTESAAREACDDLNAGDNTFFVRRIR